MIVYFIIVSVDPYRGAKDELVKEFANNYDEYERTFSIDKGLDGIGTGTFQQL